MDQTATMPPGNPIDYLALPGDVLLTIFRRIPQLDILCGAGLVCKSWWRMATGDPALWRHIDLADDEDKNDEADDVPPPEWWAMARAAVDRSAGQCESFRGHADADFVAYLAERSPSLRSFHVTSFFFMPRERFVEEVAKKLPMLERLVVSRGYFDISSEVMRALLEHCPRLELLDAAGCYNNSPLGYRLRQRCQSTIKNQRMPRWRPDSCGSCIKRTQQYADEHDY